VFPPAVGPGACVRVIAPAGPFDRTVFDRGVALLSQRYTVEYDEGIYARQGFLAGDDQRRLTELNLALRSPDVGAILIARGGHGLIRIVHAADFAALTAHPKWIVGFSDATLLHIECARAGMASIHGPNVTGLGTVDERQWSEYWEHLASPTWFRELDGLTTWRGGTARGPLFGGNLSVLHASLASGRLVLPRGCILLLEEVGEAPYRIDRMLSALLLSGVLDDVAGVVVGQMHNCHPGDYGTQAEDVVQERLGELQVPMAHAPFVGHGLPNVPLTLGLPALLQGTSKLQVGEPA